MLIAARQDEYVERVLKEVEFIIAKQPRQITAARVVALELVLRDLEKRNTLSDIAKLSERFAEYVPSEAMPIDPQWIVVFERLQDVCRDAAGYCSSLPLSWQARRSSLEDLLTDLEKISPDMVSLDTTLMGRLSEVVRRWETVALQEQQILKTRLEATGPLNNPYTAGPALERHDRLFVGRRDLVYKLEEALGRGNCRPTFFLYGERRMGKSSTLKQLPDLLGPHYIPIIYDLQSPSVCSSVAAFLYIIAEGIHQAMENRKMQVPRLELERLQEAGKENEATTYLCFDGLVKEYRTSSGARRSYAAPGL